MAREVDDGAGDLARLRQLRRIRLAAVDGALQVGELEGEHDALGGGAAVALALDDALHILLQRCELVVERGNGRGDILGLGHGGKAGVHVGLEALQVFLGGLERRRGFIAVGLEGREAGRDFGRLGLQRCDLAVDALRTRACRLTGFRRGGEAGIDLLRDILAQGVELGREGSIPDRRAGR